MSKPACNNQSIAELTRICQAQSEELSAKDVIITYLKKKVKNLEETLGQKPVLSCAADNGVLTQTNGRKRAAPEDELQTPQRKVAKNQASSFLRAASDQMKSCIRWGGILEVKFTTCVEPGVFNKVFDGCPRSHAAGEQEPGEMPEPEVQHCFAVDELDWGYFQFSQEQEVLDNTNGFVKEGRLLVGVHMSNQAMLPSNSNYTGCI
ncbi:TPA: hypothetical protein ACH3X1_009594 [Trebouxia sp. C0004]